MEVIINLFLSYVQHNISSAYKYLKFALVLTSLYLFTYLNFVSFDGVLEMPRFVQPIAHKIDAVKRTNDVFTEEKIDFSALHLSPAVLNGLRNSGYCPIT